MRAHAPYRFQPADVRHVEVHQHQIEDVAVKRSERRAARRGGADAMTGALEQTGCYQAVDLVVLDEQDVERTRGIGQRVDSRRALMLDPHQRHAEPEGAAAIDPAVHADLAAERAHQLAADGEAQPGAAEAPRNRGVGLHEGVEEVGLAALGDADAAVDHREAQPIRAFRSFVAE